MVKMIKIGLVGAGAFGANHARQLSQAENSAFQGVFDHDLDRAEDMGQRYAVRAFQTLDALFTACDAVVIATPASSHYMIALTAITAGKHVFVEKPLASTFDHAQGLVAEARSKKVVLQAGHQERFVLAALGLFATPEKPTAVESVREGPFTGRGMDVSVTLDLMIHDLDLIAVLFGDKPISVSARGRAERGPNLDAVDAHLQFPGGEARLTSSRIAEGRKRTMRVAFPSGEVKIDFLSRTMVNTTPFPLDPDFAAKAPDPLGQNVRAFLNAISDGAASPITGESGAAAVALAAAIDAACLT